MSTAHHANWRYNDYQMANVALGRPDNPMAMIQRLRAGLPYKALEDLVKALAMSRWISIGA